MSVMGKVFYQRLMEENVFVGKDTKLLMVKIPLTRSTKDWGCKLTQANNDEQKIFKYIWHVAWMSMNIAMLLIIRWDFTKVTIRNYEL